MMMSRREGWQLPVDSAVAKGIDTSRRRAPGSKGVVPFGRPGGPEALEELRRQRRDQRKRHRRAGQFNAVTLPSGRRLERHERKRKRQRELTLCRGQQACDGGEKGSTAAQDADSSSDSPGSCPASGITAVSDLWLAPQQKGATKNTGGRFESESATRSPSTESTGDSMLCTSPGRSGWLRQACHARGACYTPNVEASSALRRSPAPPMFRRHGSLEVTVHDVVVNDPHDADVMVNGSCGGASGGRGFGDGTEGVGLNGDGEHAAEEVWSGAGTTTSHPDVRAGALQDTYVRLELRQLETGEPWSCRHVTTRAKPRRRETAVVPHRQKTALKHAWEETFAFSNFVGAGPASAADWELHANLGWTVTMIVKRSSGATVGAQVPVEVSAHDTFERLWLEASRLHKALQRKPCSVQVVVAP